MPARKVNFPVFDADNHLYETQEALTKYLPLHAKRAIDFVDIRGRTKIVLRGKISEYIPNPTFEVVARPGAQEEFFRNGNPDGLSYREQMGKPIKAIPAFRRPDARLEKMDELGLDYAFMFPTLASLVEEQFKDDPDLTHDIIHALNQWIFETWSFNYDGRIFPVPIIALCDVDRALEELEWVLERGARTVMVRPAPVPGLRGSRSFGLEEFDPFWRACVDAGLPVSLHASDSGYTEMLSVWESQSEYLPFAPTPFQYAAMGHLAIEHSMLALICHGALSRNPDLRILCIENGAEWVPHLFESLRGVYKKFPHQFSEHPIDAFKRCVYVSPFWEENFKQYVDLVGADRIVFGSDWPHAEGMAEPLNFLDDLAGLPEADIAKIMGGNIISLLKLDAPVAS